MRPAAEAQVFQSTLPTRGSDLGRCEADAQSGGISIHAPHEGERPLYFFVVVLPMRIFQSTLPTRGSDTTGATSAAGISPFQSTLPTRGSDFLPSHSSPFSLRFQSTLPTRGSDVQGGRRSPLPPIDFNPRSPRGGATLCAYQAYRINRQISIHAPHEGERRPRVSQKHRPRKISIHAPHEGERPPEARAIIDRIVISIHAPHEGERPRVPGLQASGIYNFNPRSPRGGATYRKTGSSPRYRYFNPRSPRGGATLRALRARYIFCLFQSTLPTRGSDILGRAHYCGR